MINNHTRELKEMEGFWDWNGYRWVWTHEVR